MGWWEDLQSGLGIVPNAVGDTNQAIAASPVAQAARTNGSFDPNSLAAQLPPELAPDIRAMGAIDQARMAAMEKAYAKKTRTPMEFFGQALSAASVPVAYAQGNLGYANAMTGNTEADKFNAMNRDLELKRRAAMAGVGDSSLTSLGEGALSYMKDRRERQNDFRSELAKILAFGRGKDGKLNPRALKMAEDYANAKGFSAEWAKVKASLLPEDVMSVEEPKPTDAPSAPQHPQSLEPNTINGSADPAQRNNPGVLGGLSGVAANIPGAAKPPTVATADPENMTPPVYQRPQSVQDMYDEAELAMSLDPKRGALLKAQAEIADRTAAGIFEAQQKAKYASRQSTSIQPVQYYNPKTKKFINVQPTTTGEGKVTRLPPGYEDYEVVDQAYQAGRKAEMVKTGTLSAEAQAALPVANDNANIMIATIEKLRDAPGRKNLTGKMFGNTVWADSVPDYYEETGKARSFLAQLNGQAFLQAFNQLKGGGQITEVEGAKAQAAINRLQELKVSDEAYEEAIKDAIDRVEELRKLAIDKANNGLLKDGLTKLRTSTGYLIKGADGIWREDNSKASPDRTSVGAAGGENPYANLNDDEFLKRKR